MRKVQQEAYQDHEEMKEEMKCSKSSGDVMNCNGYIEVYWEIRKD